MSRSIIITGASQGIGAATAEEFLNAAWPAGCWKNVTTSPSTMPKTAMTR